MKKEPHSPLQEQGKQRCATGAHEVQVFLRQCNETRDRPIVKTRTDLPRCTLTLADFGPVEPDGDLWSYIEDNLGDDNVPSRL
jgi:hypothetical protein